MILSEAINKYLVRLELKGQSEVTRKSVGFLLRAFEKWLMERYGMEDSRYIRKFHLLAYQKYIGLECDHSPTYINQKVMSVNAFMRYLAREAEAISNLDIILECIKQPKRLPKVISIEQYDQIRNAMMPLDNKWALRDYTIITLFMSSGIRVGGFSRLQVKDINLDERTVRVIGKGNKERLAVFGEQCQEVLRVYLKSVRPLLKGANTNDALFISRKNKAMSISAIRNVVKQAAKKAGIDERVTPHTFRRTFCTELIKANGNLYHIAQMMGHESLEHLKCYARLNIKPLIETHKKCHPRG